MGAIMEKVPKIRKHSQRNPEKCLKGLVQFHFIVISLLLSTKREAEWWVNLHSCKFFVSTTHIKDSE